MRFLFIISTIFLLALATLTGCNTAVEKAAANKVIVLAAMDAMNSQQYDSFDQFFAEDLKRHCQATPEVKISSLAEMIPFVKGWYAAFPDAIMETRMTAAEGDLVACWGTFTGTHLAPMGDIPATGKRMESETFAFFRLLDGKIIEMWVTWDNVAVLRQLGLFPPPAPDQTPEKP